MQEIWKDIPGTDRRYQVSNFGRARSWCNNNEGRSKAPKILRPGTCSKTGYVKIAIWGNGKHRTIALHRIVAELFIDNPENKKYVNHIDHDRSNPHVENLEWCTAKENTKHAIDAGRIDHSHLKKFGEDHGMAKLTKKAVLDIREKAQKRGRFYGQEELCEKYGVSKSLIKQVVNRTIWTHV